MPNECSSNEYQWHFWVEKNISSGVCILPISGCLVSFCNYYVLKKFKEIPVFNANSVDPYQVPCSAASDLGLH